MLKILYRIGTVAFISGLQTAFPGTLGFHKFYGSIGAVEPHHMLQCLDPADDLDEVFFHPELPVHVNKQADLPAYLKQLALERIGDIPIDAVQFYTNGSRDDYYRSGSGIYIKSQDHILKNPEDKIQTVARFFAGKGKQTTYWLLGENIEPAATSEHKEMAKETHI
ncbi:uncharacterized protein TNCV_3855541 [Trichonephila clavipes]|nr:uncharacterized protein TNCV_3855541 [Trichonephila clavipes]